MRAKDVPTYDRTLATPTLLSIYNELKANPLSKSEVTRQHRRLNQLKIEIEHRGIKP